MDQTAPHPARTDSPASEKDRPAAAAPSYIGAILSVVRILLGYGMHLDQTLPDRADHPGFPTLAAGFGTHDIRRILRAMMLQRFLLARAAQGRDIEPTQPAGPAAPEDIEALEVKLRAPRQTPLQSQRRAPRIDLDDPLHFRMPALKELEFQVRRRSVGRTIADICLDLGIAPGICDGGFWNEIYQTLAHFAGNSEEFFSAQTNRRKSFEKEREKRPGSWALDWRDRPKDAIRQLLGFVLGEPPPIPLAAS